MWSLTKQNRYAISVEHNPSSLFEKICTYQMTIILAWQPPC